MDRKTKDRKDGWTDKRIDKREKTEGGGISKVEGKGKREEDRGRGGRENEKRRETKKGA